MKAKLKKLLTITLSSLLVFNSLNLTAFAKTTVEFDVKNGSTLSFSEIIGKVGEPSLSKVVETYNLTWEKGSKEIEVEIEDLLYHIRVNDELYNNKSHMNSNINFETGLYDIYKGSAEYDVSLKESTEWKNEYDSLLLEIEDLKEEVSNAEEALNTANNELSVEKGKLTLAQTAQNLAQQSYDETLDNYNNADANYEQAKADLVTEKENLVKAQNTLDTAQSEYDSAYSAWDSETNTIKKAVLKAALDAAKKVLDAAQSALDDAKVSYAEKEEALSDADSYKAYLKEQLDEKSAALDNAKANTESAQASVTAAEEKVAEAQNSLDASNTVLDTKWEEVAAHVETITSDDFDYTFVSYSYLNEEEYDAFYVNVYNELTVNTSVTTGEVTAPSAVVNNADGVIDENTYKVYDTNESVTIEVEELKGYNFEVAGATHKESNIYEVGSLMSDKEVTVTYTPAGYSSIQFVNDEIANVTVKDADGNDLNLNAIPAETVAYVTITAKEHYEIENVVLTNKEGTELGTYTNGNYKQFAFTVNPGKTDEGEKYTLTINGEYTSSKITLDIDNEDVITIETDYVWGEPIKYGDTIQFNIAVKDNYEMTYQYIVDENGDTICFVQEGDNSFYPPKGFTGALKIKTESLYNEVLMFSEEDLAMIDESSLFIGLDKENSCTLNEIPVNSTVYVKFDLTDEWMSLNEPLLTVMDVTNPENENEVSVTESDGFYSFKTNTKGVYKLYLNNDNIKSTYSTIAMGEITGANVKVSVDGSADYELTSDSEIKDIKVGSQVVVTITPDENLYVTNAEVVSLSDIQVMQVLQNIDKENGIYKITLTANSDNYVVNVETDNIVLPNENEVAIDKYDILYNDYTSVKCGIDTAFDVAENVEISEYQYLAGTVHINETKVLGIFTIPEINVPIWRNIEDEVPSADELAEEVLQAIKEVSPTIGGLISKNTVKTIIEESGSVIDLHSFGDKAEETVRVLTKESNDYQATTSDSRVVKIEDLRTEVDVDVNENITVVYGSYLTNDELLEKLLEGKLGLVVNGEQIVEDSTHYLALSKDLSKANVGTYTLTVYLENEEDPEYKDVEKKEVTIEVVKADATVTMTTNNVIKYENINKVNADFLYDITTDVLIEEEVAHVPFVIGMNTDNMVATIDMSKLITSNDELIQTLIDSALKLAIGNGKTMTLSEFLPWAKDLILNLEKVGLETNLTEDDFKVLYKTLEEITNEVDLEITVTVDGESYVPNRPGVYVVGVLTTDPNYNTAYGVTYLVLLPEVIEETLSWNFDDLNGVITQPVLDKISLGATANINPENTSRIEYKFIQLDKEVNVSIISANQDNIDEVSKNLQNGAYVQVAYIYEELNDSMLLCEPLIRTFIHAPQQVNIEFKPDENVENVRTFEYNGNPIEMPVVVEKLDGSELKEECLEIKYSGVDSFGNKVHSTEAPTNVGVYVVTATYIEYDENGSLKYAGINVGVMVITPAETKINSYIEDVECPCECDDENCPGNENCSTELDIPSKIEVEDGVEYITIVYDEEGNVNIILPEEWNVETTDVKEELKALMDEISSELSGIDFEINENIVNTIKGIIASFEFTTPDSVKEAVMDAIEKIKDEVGEIKSLVINNEEVYKCGNYSVIAIAFGNNYKVAILEDEFTVYPKEAEDLVDPDNPQNPEDPTEPDNPTDPEEPVNPEDPTDPEEPVNPEEPTNPVDPDDSVDPEDPTEPEKDDEKVVEDNKGTETPNTGDNYSVYLYSLGLLLSFAILTVLGIKRKINN